MAEPMKSVFTEMASKHERLLVRLMQNEGLATLVMFTITQTLLECRDFGKMLDEIKFTAPQINGDKLVYQFYFGGNGKIIVRPPLQRGDELVQFFGKYNRALSDALRHDEFIRLFTSLVDKFDNFAHEKNHKISDVEIERAGLSKDRTFFATLKIREDN